jgi:hypothetical protein
MYMKTRLHLGRSTAILACVASLAGTAAFLAPSAATAKAATSCANKNFPIKSGTAPAIHVPVKAITAEGTSCAEADKLIRGTLEGKLPSGWHSALGQFKVPVGLIPTEITKGSKRITYGVRGG